MSRKEKHFWLTATDPETGKFYLLYACPAREGEEGARQKGFELLPGYDFQIKELPTRDRSAASAMMRGKRLETTHSLKKSGERMGHERSAKRLRRNR